MYTSTAWSFVTKSSINVSKVVPSMKQEARTQVVQVRRQLHDLTEVMVLPIWKHTQRRSTLTCLLCEFMLSIFVSFFS